MCNCGNKREALSSQQSFGLSNTNSIGNFETKMWPDVEFEYTGKTALSVKGNVSGKSYRFSAPGEMQAIDYRDASSLMGVPVLRRLR